MNCEQKAAPVSVVIPCWCCADTIDRAVHSVAMQSVPPMEVILVDDGSPDDTLNTLHLVQKRYQHGWIKVVALSSNQGPGAARNKGWEVAVQPWIAFLDADDVWHPRKIELQYGWITRNRQAVLCGHETMVVESDECAPEITQSIASSEVSFKDMLIANRFATRSVMVRSDVEPRFKGKHVTEDYLLWLQLVLEKKPCYRLNAPLAMSFRPDSSRGGYSGDLWRHERRELAAWRTLQQDSMISWPVFSVAYVWSLVKYARRVVKRALGVE